MPGPPPAPPPPPPPPATLLGRGSSSSNGGGASKPMPTRLLSEIHQGTKLKKAVTNDRSAPMLGKVVASNSPPQLSSTTNGAASTRSQPQLSSSGGPSGFGGLFANGVVPRKPSELKAANSGIPLTPNKATPPVGRQASAQQANKPSTPPKIMNGKTQPASATMALHPSSSVSSPKWNNGVHEPRSRNHENGDSPTPPPPPLQPSSRAKPALPTLPPAVKQAGAPPGNSSAATATNSTVAQLKQSLAHQSSQPQQLQFQTLQRPPQRSSGSNLRRSGSGSEKMGSVKPMSALVRRPAMPPPPPPVPANQQPVVGQQHKQAQPESVITRPSFPQTGNARSGGGVPDVPPPPPPPRNSSCVDSFEQRFHFLSLNELPSQPSFANLKKVYDSSARRQHSSVGVPNHF